MRVSRSRSLVLGCLAAVASALLSPSAAHPAVPLDVVSPQAVNDHVVFGSSSLGCTEGQWRIAVSVDRGESWTREGTERCANITVWGRVGSRAVVSGFVIGVVPELIDASLVRTPVPAGPATGSGGSSYSALGGSLYKAGQSWYRLQSDGQSWTACGALPGTYVSGFPWQGPRGIYTLRQMPGDAVGVVMSRDGCQSWETLSLPECSPSSGSAAGAWVLITCGSGLNDRRASMDDRIWAPIYDTSYYPWMNGISGRVVQVSASKMWFVDRFSVLDDLSTWRRVDPRPSDPGIPSEQATEIEWINARYRRPIGLPDLTWSARLALAAQNHASYYVPNGFTGHDESPGRPGFTGGNPGERCLVLPLLGPCGTEVAYSGPALHPAIEGWLNTPYHGAPFVFSQAVGFGWSSGGSVGRLDVGDSTPTQGLPGGELDLSAAPNTPGSLLRVWPANGTTDVPTQWAGGESPDPLRNYTGDRENVGPVFLMLGYRQPLTVTLTGPGGAELLLPAAGVSASPEAVLPTSGGGEPGNGRDDFLASDPATFVFAARPLRPGARYTLRVTDRDGRAVENTFTTDPNGVGPKSPTPAAKTWVLGARVTVKRFRPVPKTKAMRVGKGGLPVRVTSNRKGAAVLMYQRRLPGRRVGATCKAGKPGKGQRACVRWVTVRGQLRASLRAGMQVVRLTGVAGGRRLVPGVYRIRVATVARPVRQASTGAIQVVR